MAMKVLFINPPFTEFGGLEGHGGKALPLNLAYLASCLREREPGVEIEALDCEALGLDHEEIERRIRAVGPDIAAVTAPTPAFSQVLKVCRTVKAIAPEIVTVAGGPHPTALLEETAAEPDIDIAVDGEGEITFADIVRAVRDRTPLSEVKGIAYKDANAAVRRTAPRPLIEDLDSLPFPARDLFPLDLYFPPPTKRMSDKKAGNMITSRGCPYRCTYCMATVMWRHRVRFRGVANVVDEIEECGRRFGLGEFNFHDELFTVNRQRTLDFCAEVLRRKLDIAWVCMCRVDYLDMEVLRAMRRAGCLKIMFGFESGSQMILDTMKKKVALDKAQEAVRMVNKAGIRSAGNFMLGNLGETDATIRQTIDLAKRLNCDTMAFFIASPYPGTEFYDMARQRGYLRSDVQWKDFTLVSNNTPPLDLPGLPAQRLMWWQKKAYREYYLRPRYVLGKLASIRTRTDVANLYNGAKLFLKLEK
jgi:radical SAM superfamily enzyme YgiQ (UPF0313 family)